MSGLYRELLPHFPSSSFVHVGLDETVDVGSGRSRAITEEVGAEAVMLDYLLKVSSIARMFGKTPMYWADMLYDFPPGFLDRLPDDAIACEWGYEDNHPFESQCARLAEAGVPFLVCPGTSSWSSFSGRTANCIENIKAAAQAAMDHGGVGLLLTDWGDFGHMQPLCVSYPAMIAAAGFAWSTRIEGHSASSSPTADADAAAAAAAGGGDGGDAHNAAAAAAAVVTGTPTATEGVSESNEVVSGGGGSSGSGDRGEGGGGGGGKQLNESGWSNVWGEDELSVLLDAHIFKPHTGGSLGRIMCDLGNTYLHAGGDAATNRNGTLLFKILISGAGGRDASVKGASIAGLRAASKHLKHQLVCLDKIVAGESDATIPVFVRSMTHRWLIHFVFR